MRAVVFTRTGDPSVLSVVDRPVAEPEAGEVRVRIHRSGVNPTDWKTRSAAPGTPVDPPQVPDHDGAGVVDAVGDDVVGTPVGTRVWIREAAYGRPDGTAQEYAIVPADLIAPLPDSAGFDLGACLGVPFVTAHRCLTVAEDGPARLAPGALGGRLVLVTGGAGAVGNAAIQLARWSGATVLSTVSGPEKGALASAAGAEHVIDYTEPGVVDRVRQLAPGGVDRIVEVAAAANGGFDADVLAPGGTVAVYAGVDADTTVLPVRRLMTLNARWQFVLLYSVPEQAKRTAVEAIGAALTARAIDVGESAGLPLHHYALAQTAQAHAAVENGAVGKVLVDVS